MVSRKGPFMSIFSGKRLTNEVFKLDIERMRRGWYSDKYFENSVRMYEALVRRGYRFGGRAPELEETGVSLREVATGDIRVEMQWFPRREPFTLVVGVDKALAMLRHCTGYFEPGERFVETHDRLEVWAVEDGEMVGYEGDPMRVSPVIVVRGRYRDFAVLETPTLGTLTRSSRIATNVYRVLVAARGKPVLFFPARFDAHEIQAADGYAYDIAVRRYAMDSGRAVGSFVSTDAQGDWWGGAGGGTVAHAAIASFLGDTAELMMQFAETQPVGIPRIALVDFHNDSVGDSLAVLSVMFGRYRELVDRGDEREAEKYRLYGVRLDTAGDMRDISVPDTGDTANDCGVTPELVRIVRRELDHASNGWDLPGEWCERAAEYCRGIRIVATGGFDPMRIERFEREQVPVDIYGVGSWLLSSCKRCGTNNDFTADVVRVEVGGVWVIMAKEGREPGENPDLRAVTWDE
jgi:nicotinate phosphoribosyltransferase